MTKLTTILIVDDDPLILTVIVQVITRALAPTIHILTAYNGEDGLNKALETQPDLIITDLMMPKMDGYEMVQLLRREQTANQMRIIGVTSSGAIDAKTNAFRTICDTFLTKPFMPNELLEKLNCLA